MYFRSLEVHFIFASSKKKQTMIVSQELVILVLQKLQDAIISESNQHSVRLMQEWLMTRILMRYSDLHDRLWKFFAEVAQLNFTIS